MEENIDEKNNNIEDGNADINAMNNEAIAEEVQFSNLTTINKAMFKKLQRTAPYRFYPHLTNDEKNIVKAMEKIDKRDVQKFKTLMANKVQAFWHKVKLIFAPIIPVLPIILIVLIACLTIAAAVDSIFGIGGSSGGNNGMSSQFGITGEKFYGARLVYVDEEQSKADMLKNFVGVLSEVESAVETADGNIDITLSIPANDYDYLTFEETAFSADYPDAYQIIFDLTKLVAENDLIEGEAVGASVNENLGLIKYFGYNSTLTPQMAEIISNYINSNNLYTYNSDEETDTTTIENLITSTTANVLSNQKYQVRAEKLYVIDYILSGENRMENIPNRNYKYMIFMPKQNVTFNYFSFIVKDIDYSNFSMTLKNADGEILLTSTLYTSTEDVGFESYLYESNSNLTVQANAFTDIDSDNLNALSQGMSLIDIVNSDLNSDIYLTEMQAESVETSDMAVKTIKLDGVYAEFNSEQEFCFAELETRS